MTITEAATRLGISPGAVRALVKAGRLRSRRPGLGRRKIVLDAADVEAYWESLVETTPDQPMPARVPGRRYRCRYL